MKRMCLYVVCLLSTILFWSQLHATPVLAGSFRAMNVCYYQVEKVKNGKTVVTKDCFLASSPCNVQGAKSYGKYSTSEAANKGLQACKQS